jgi:hypothetical protein
MEINKIEHVNNVTKTAANVPNQPLIVNHVQLLTF